METVLTDKLWLNGDPDLLKQAILNVVNNGLEAMSEGGKLVIRTEWIDDECQIRVTDGGPGIPPEIQDRIFNLYFTTKQQGSGNRLGDDVPGGSTSQWYNRFCQRAWKRHDFPAAFSGDDGLSR